MIDSFDNKLWYFEIIIWKQTYLLFSSKYNSTNCKNTNSIFLWTDMNEGNIQISWLLSTNIIIYSKLGKIPIDKTHNYISIFHINHNFLIILEKNWIMGRIQSCSLFSWFFHKAFILFIALAGANFEGHSFLTPI